MCIFEKLGFSWQRDCLQEIESQSFKDVVYRYKDSIARFVYDASSLEGNPFEYQEIKTLMGGITVGGHLYSDQQQVINLVNASKELFHLVYLDKFTVSKSTSDILHKLISFDEALEWGNFRGEGKEINLTPNVNLGKFGSHIPPKTIKHAPELNLLYENGIKALTKEIRNPLERGIVYFLFGALNQFYFDGNKRTARFIMNGILMSNGIDAISIPETKADEFNEKMVNFYKDKEATEMMFFVKECQKSVNLSEQIIKP